MLDLEFTPYKDVEEVKGDNTTLYRTQGKKNELLRAEIKSSGVNYDKVFIALESLLIVTPEGEQKVNLNQNDKITFYINGREMPLHDNAAIFKEANIFRGVSQFDVRLKTDLEGDYRAVLKFEIRDLSERTKDKVKEIVLTSKIDVSFS